MPTVLRIDGYEIMIYMHDHLPPHVHVFGRDCESIVLLECPNGEPQIRESFHCRANDAKDALKIVKEHRELLCAMWKEIHGNF